MPTASPRRNPKRNAAMTASAMPIGDMVYRGGAAFQLILKLLATEKGLPENAGTRTARKRPATQAPVGVPSKGGPVMVALWATPLGANSTTTRPVPIGPPGFLQDSAAAAADASRDLASPMLKAASTTGAGAAGVLVPGACALGGVGFGAGALAAAFVSPLLSLGGAPALAELPGGGSVEAAGTAAPA